MDCPTLESLQLCARVVIVRVSCVRRPSYARPLALARRSVAGTGVHQRVCAHDVAAMRLPSNQRGSPLLVRRTHVRTRASPRQCRRTGQRQRVNGGTGPAQSIADIWPSCVGGAGAGWRRTYVPWREVDGPRKPSTGLQLRAPGSEWELAPDPVQELCKYVRTYVRSFLPGAESCLSPGPGREPARPWEGSEGSVPVDGLFHFSTGHHGTRRVGHEEV